MHNYKILDLLDHPNGVIEGAVEFVSTILSDFSSPFRIIGELIDEINTNEQIQSNMVLERLFHSKFDRFNGLVLCSYDVNKNHINTNGKWMETILESHICHLF